MQLNSLSIKYDGRQLLILDQQQLPQKEVWNEVHNPDQMIDQIKSLKVRGAPAIGIAAAFALDQYFKSGVTADQYFQAAQKLRTARPTAVNLMHAMDRMTSFPKGDLSEKRVESAATAIFREDVDLCDRIAENGAALIADGDHVLTYCNTGGLATAGVGTAIGILRKAHEQGRDMHVYVSETRPLLQGGRLTAWEMATLGIPHTLICDNMVAMLMAKGEISMAIVGADRVAMNGDFANKIGTYNLAVLCHFHRIPFYVAAPSTTVDPACKSGRDIPIEQRDADEVRGVRGGFGRAQWAPSDAPVFNPAFDVTPAGLVTGWIFDAGVFYPSDVSGGKLQTLFSTKG